MPSRLPNALPDDQYESAIQTLLDAVAVGDPSQRIALLRYVAARVDPSLASIYETAAIAEELHSQMTKLKCQINALETTFQALADRVGS